MPSAEGKDELAEGRATDDKPKDISGLDVGDEAITSASPKRNAIDSHFIPDNVDVPSVKKRSAERQITKDNGEDECGDECVESVTGTFTKAHAKTLASRRNVKAALSFSSVPTPAPATGTHSTVPSFGASTFGGFGSTVAPSNNPFLLAAKAVAGGGGFGFGNEPVSPPSALAGLSQPPAPIFAGATRQTSTGEENELCRLQMRCKLYRLEEGGKNNWIECGIGNARILAAEGKKGKTERARITQRQEQTSRLILNTVLQKDRATVFRKGDKHVQLIVISSEKEEKLPSTYLFKFSNKGNAKEFLDALEGLGHVRVTAYGDDRKKEDICVDQKVGFKKKD